MATTTDYNHLFRTLLGLPPEKGDKPLCGADLPDSWDFPGVDRPPCPECLAAVPSLSEQKAEYAWVKIKAGEYRHGDYTVRKVYDRAAGGTQWRLTHPNLERAVWFDTLADAKDHVTGEDA